MSFAAPKRTAALTGLLAPGSPLCGNTTNDKGSPPACEIVVDADAYTCSPPGAHEQHPKSNHSRRAPPSKDAGRLRSMLGCLLRCMSTVVCSVQFKGECGTQHSVQFHGLENIFAPSEHPEFPERIVSPSRSIGSAAQSIESPAVQTRHPGTVLSERVAADLASLCVLLCRSQ